MGKFAPIAIRYLIIAVVQLGLVSLAEKYVIPYLNKAIEEIMVLFGVNRDEAQDILANEILQYAESIGIFAVVLRTKMPVKVAEMLGFTSKGYNKRTIANKLATAKKGTAATKRLSNTNAVVLSGSESTVIVEQAIKSKLGFKAAYDVGLKTLGVTFLGFMTVGNWLDFGNWNSGAYQKSMQKFIAWISFGNIVPDQDYRKSKTVSDDIFSKVYQTFQLGGAMGIQDPYKGVDVPFTRDNLMDLLDQLGATLLLTTGSASTKNVLKASLPMIIFNTSADLDKVLNTTQDHSHKTTQSVSVPIINKVFSGIVSQGVVGAGLSFTPRPDDIIESADELRQAAANNLTPYLNTLLGKIVYEVKVVSRIVSKEGFVQTGTTQRIQTGTFSNGTPKYKTVTNKFAILVVYALTDKGSRAKLTTIVLGPTDSAKLTVGQNDLRTLEAELPKTVTTTDVNEINVIKTDTPTVVEQKENVPVETEKETNIFLQNYKGKVLRLDQVQAILGIDKETPAGTRTITALNRFKDKWNLSRNGIIDQETMDLLHKNNGSFVPYVSVPDTAPVVSTAATKPAGAGANATTLFEWYQTQGQNMPSVSARATLYEEKGLGSRSYYTGTAEQNTKLLQALKGATNVATFVPPAFKSIITDTYLQAS